MQAANLVLLSDQMALSRSMDVVANNIANSSTSGFKREGIEFNTYVSRPQPDKPAYNFVVDHATYRDAAGGPIEPTGNPLDLAIQGQGYFQVQATDGSTRYTRAGAFRLDTEGRIVTQSGDPILGDGGQPITLPETTSEINIASDGFVSARIDNGAALAQIGKVSLVKFADEQQLLAAGNGVYTTQETPTADEDGSIVQGSLEKSNVEPVTEMTNMIQIMRNYEQIANIISNENQRHSTAIDKLSQTT